MQLSLSVEEIARITGPQRIEGNTSSPIARIAPLGEAGPGDLSFLGNPRYKKEAAGSRASLIFVPADYDGAPGENQVLFYQESTTLALARVCSRIEQRLWPKPPPGVHPTAVLAEGCRVSPGASIGPLCIVEEGAVIGEGAVLQGHVFVGRGSVIGEEAHLSAQVTIQGYCRIGRRVRIHSGVVIGGDGFGYHTDEAGHHQKLPQVGEVTVGDDVEIGAGSTIDRARFGRTEIGEGTRIDNLVQIGHNVVIGRHCLIVAQVGIAGSSQIEDNVVIGGQAGIAGHLRVGRGSMIGGKSGVGKSLPPKSYVSGSPALPALLDQKVSVLRKRLPELFREVDKLQSAVKKLSMKP